MAKIRKGVTLSTAAVACLLCQSAAFAPYGTCAQPRNQRAIPSSPTSVSAEAEVVPSSSFSDDISSASVPDHPLLLRRSFVAKSIAATLGIAIGSGFGPGLAIAADGGKLDPLLSQIKEARDQLEGVPDLIKDEKWDGVRAILVKPPLSNMWTSGGQNKLLNNYADAIGEETPDGDEIAALELREDAISHLRYLDMAVYNNIFNPIGTEGTNGATKELVRSYYEDPTNEWKASKAAIDGLIGLATP